MLELPNFDHMTTSIIFQNNYILIGPKVDDFTDINKIASMFIKTMFIKVY